VILRDKLAADDSKVPTAALRKLVRSDKATFLEISDSEGSSALHDIEHLYHPDKLLFIVHRGLRPFLYCLIGERLLTSSTWKSAAKIVTELQGELYGRSKAGRKKNLTMYRQAVRLQSAPGSQKVRAHQLVPTPRSAKDLAAHSQYLYQVAVEMRGKPKRKSRKKNSRKKKQPVQPPANSAGITSLP